MLIGAGKTGEKIAREIMTTSRHQYSIAGFIDDNVEKHGALLHGKKIFCSIGELPNLQVKYDDAKGRPRLFFVDTKGKAYFQIRNFFQQSGGGTIRNYVEALEKFAEYSNFVPYDS